MRGDLALTAQAPAGTQCGSSLCNSVACHLSIAFPQSTIPRIMLLESRQEQPLLTPSAQHWYPFGSTKRLNAMPESYKGPNVKQGGPHSQNAPSLTTHSVGQMDAGRPLI